MIVETIAIEKLSASDRASKFIRENYTWDKIAVKMIDVYQKILDRQSFASS